MLHICLIALGLLCAPFVLAQSPAGELARAETSTQNARTNATNLSESMAPTALGTTNKQTTSLSNGNHSPGTGNGEAIESALPLSPGTDFSLTSYFQALGMLFFLLAVLWFAVRYLKKKGRGGSLMRRVISKSKEKEQLTIENRYSFGPKNHLIVARFGDKRLLLGMTEHHITRLAEITLAEQEYSEINESCAPPEPEAAEKASHAQVNQKVVCSCKGTQPTSAQKTAPGSSSCNANAEQAQPFSSVLAHAEAQETGRRHDKAEHCQPGHTRV